MIGNEVVAVQHKVLFSFSPDTGILYNESFNYLEKLNAQLNKVLPPPISNENPRSLQWDLVEAKNKIIFPQDYKHLLHSYGEGSIDDFFWLLTPFNQDKNINIFSQLDTMKNSYNYAKENLSVEFNYEFFPCTKGLFPWCITENGDELYWIKYGTAYKVVVFGARYAVKYEYEMGVVEFLYKLLTKEIECNAFPMSLWDQPHFFCVSNQYQT